MSDEEFDFRSLVNNNVINYFVIVNVRGGTSIGSLILLQIIEVLAVNGECAGRLKVQNRAR